MSEKTSTGKIVAAIGGVILIVSLFLKWSGVDIPDNLSGAASQFGNPAVSGPAQQAIQSAQQTAQQAAEDAASANAFDMFSWIPILYLVIGVLAILPAALDIFNLEIELPFQPSLVTLVGGLIVLGGMLLVLDSPGSIKLGAWLALLGAIAITAGGLMQVEGPSAGSGSVVAAAPPGYAPQAAPAPQPQQAVPAPPAPPTGAPPAAQPPGFTPPQPPQPPGA